jgi:hypothetical protein
LNTSKGSLQTAALAALLLAAGARAEAKVVFTGYGDVRVTPHSETGLEAPPALLSAFGVTDTTSKPRTSRVEMIGVFATTNLSDGLDFVMDVNYRQIGARTNELRLQYAYLDYRPGPFTVQVGRVFLPLGYLNTNRFYPFQRTAISAPLFHSSILGLPISDAGAVVGKKVQGESFAASLEAYGVNGYGPTTGSTTSFRNAAVGGSLVIANNLGSQDANNRTAYGGRLRLMTASERSEIGASYYGGQWDPAGNHMFSMMNGHLHLDLAGLDILYEHLLAEAEGDRGFALALAHPDWKTAGYFVEAAYKGFRVREKPLIPWARYEAYATRPDGGGAGREKLRGAAAGLTFRPIETLSVKLEASRLRYVLPFQTFGGNIDLETDSYILGLAFTF